MIEKNVLLNKAGWTADQLATRLGVTVAEVNAWTRIPPEHHAEAVEIIHSVEVNAKLLGRVLRAFANNVESGDSVPVAMRKAIRTILRAEP